MVGRTEGDVERSRRNGRAVRWIDHRLPIFTFVNHELNDYPTPRNLNYWWNFGSLAGFMLVVMILTGVALGRIKAVLVASGAGPTHGSADPTSPM